MMKRISGTIVLFACLQLFFFIPSVAFGQKLKSDDIPDNVKQNMEFEHPAGKVSGWTIEDNQFVATFKEDGATGKAYFKNDGTWLRSAYPVPKGELPSAISDFVKNNYQNYAIAVSMLQTTPNEKMHYYLEVKPEGIAQQKSVLTFDNVGKLLSRNDPEPVPEPEKPKPAEKKESSAKAPAEKKPATSEKKEDKPVAQKAKPEPQPKKDPQPKKEPEPKKAPEPKKTETTQKAPEPKKEKTKKEKEVKPITDEYGNIAIPNSQVPEVVSKMLIKKIPRPEKLNWFKIDTMYVAKCMYREQKNDVFITPKGVWVSTFIHLGETAVTGAMMKHLNSFYKDWKFKQAIKEVRADKNDKFMVEIYEKENYKDKLVTTILFDKTGKLIRTIDPDYALGGRVEDTKEDESLEKYYEKMSMGMKDDVKKDIPAAVLNAFKAKYPRITNEIWGNDEEGNYTASYLGPKGKEVCVIGQSGTILQTLTVGNPDFLSSNIDSYIKQNYKGYKVDEYYKANDLLEKRAYFKVMISNKKTKDALILWFNNAGKFVDR